MRALTTDIEGVIILEPEIHGDARGYFFEAYSDRDFARLTGLGTLRFVQDNQSMSHRGVVRGLHLQLPPHTQDKLVSVAVGRVLDVAVDLRSGSPTFGRYVAAVLDDVSHRRMFIPAGMAHGFAVLSDMAIFQYKCSDYYHPECEAAIAWDDPQIGIDWHLDAADVILSDKDRRHGSLQDFINEHCKD